MSDSPRPDDRFREACAAAVTFGPRGSMPSAIRDALHDAVRAGSSRDENPEYLALAFGCGWRRALGASPWEQRWEGAILALVDEFERSVRITIAMLSGLVPDIVVDRDEQRAFAELLAVQFAAGCRCGRHRRSCPGRDDHGRDDHGCCIERHRLDAWDPTVAHLAAYIDQAVRGIAGRTLRGAAFADGMLYAQLAREGRVRRATVEARVCGRCGTRVEVGMCRDPRCASETLPPRCVAQVNRLVVPQAAGGCFRPIDRWRCGDPDCASLFPRSFVARCTRCGWEPEPGCRPRVRTVWVASGRACAPDPMTDRGGAGLPR